MFGHLLRIEQIELLRFLYKRIDDVDLSAFSNDPIQKMIDLVARPLRTFVITGLRPGGISSIIDRSGRRKQSLPESAE